MARKLVATHVVALIVGFSLGLGAVAYGAREPEAVVPPPQCYARNASKNCLVLRLERLESEFFFQVKPTVRNWCVYLGHANTAFMDDRSVAALFENLEGSCFVR